MSRSFGAACRSIGFQRSLVATAVSHTASYNSLKIPWQYPAGYRREPHLPDGTASRGYSRQYQLPSPCKETVNCTFRRIEAVSKEVRARICCDVERPALRMPNVRINSKTSFALSVSRSRFIKEAFRGLRIHAPELRDFHPVDLISWYPVYFITPGRTRGPFDRSPAT